MDSTSQDYFAIPDSKPVQQRAGWGNDWQPISPWETTPGEMPIWQYTTAALHNGEPQMAYYPLESPISPYADPRSNPPTALSSPVTAFANDGRYTPMTPMYDLQQLPSKPNRSPTQLAQLQVPEFVEGAEGEDVMDDEDSEDAAAWSNRSPNTPPSSANTKKRPSHRRSLSVNETSLKNAKRAHTVVERNYRERLNDKIADLALYLFETSSDSRTKPSKSLVMTRAKERLKQLESRNKSLEAEVVKLRQHIAILDHIVTTKSGGMTPPQTS